MASSFLNQVPTIIHIIQKVKPRKIIDIGKGFGKYGFLIHEYLGIDNQKRIDPRMMLKDQSAVSIDAVEVDPDLMLPHLTHIYNKVYFGDVLKIYADLPDYDLALMIDVIEHIDKEKATEMLRYFISKGTKIIVATPINYFQQHLYESSFEEHVSHWKLSDFSKLCSVEVQYFNAGAVYLISKQKMDIRGYGNSLIKKLRRVALALKNEF